MNKINYDKLMTEIVSGLEKKEKLLLHSCCAPCSTACIERLEKNFNLTIYYYNPNMDSQEEFLLRRAEQQKYCQNKNIEVILEEYLSEQYQEVVVGLENEPEGGKRCEKCFYLRLDKTAQKAKEFGFTYFATTLTVSPLKNAELINEIGYKIAKKHGVNYLPTDFKKQGGYLRSIELSKQNQLYRQNYCGCEFSKHFNKN
ncbi:MAG: epoxyqueuosine reductase QueH [Clostridiales bacterium]|nr:epoxyqueuosine reductase QueH [Clostridiales bacterium]